MGAAGRHARHLLRRCPCSAGTRPERADQAVLVDFAQPALLFLLHRALAAGGLLLHRPADHRRAGLFLINAVVGRVWCGYVCPQTVWTDLFYRGRALIEGDRRERMQLDAAPWTPRRVAQERRQACDLADHRLVDRRRLGLLFRRRADAGAASSRPSRRRAVAYVWIGILTFTTYCSPASCASRSASTCARGRASRRR